jgi:methylmalonyl-CoA mutase, N-terminal domain
LNDGGRVLVGVNQFQEPDEPEADILYIGPEAEALQRRRLADVKAGRDEGAVHRALGRVRQDAMLPDVNVMPGLIEAVGAYATVGEIMSALGQVFGTWTERAVV